MKKIKYYRNFLICVLTALICVTAAFVNAYAEPADVASMSGLVYWFDAADADTLTLANGDRVSAWENKANSSASAAQGTNTARPTYVAESKINGLPAVRLASGTNMPISNSETNYQAQTIFVVFNPDMACFTNSGGDNNQIFSKLGIGDPWNHNWYFNIENDQISYGWRDGVSHRSGKVAVVADENFIITAQKNGGSGTLYKNGDKAAAFTHGATASTNTTLVRIGGGAESNHYSMKGDLGEIIMFNRALTEIEIASVNEYLADKWGMEYDTFDIDETEGIVAWYDAYDLTLTDGEKVAEWPNKANPGVLTAVQDNVARQPVYTAKSVVGGFPAVLLDDDLFLKLEDSESIQYRDMTVFAVVNLDRATSGRTEQIFSKLELGGGNHNWYFNVENARFNFGWKEYGGGWPNSVGQNKVITPGRNVVLGGSKNAQNGVIYIDGEFAGSWSGGNANPDYNDDPIAIGSISGDKSVKGAICEIILFDRGLTDAEMKGVTKYLEDKWIPVDITELSQELRMWYDAYDLLGVIDDGAPVASWPNKAPNFANTYDAIQNSTVNRPVFLEEGKVKGQPGVKLSKETYLNVSGSNNSGFSMANFSIFAVVNCDDLSGDGDNNQIFSRLGTASPWNHNWYFNIHSGLFNFGWKSAASNNYFDYRAAGTALNANVNYVLGGVKDGARGSLYINGRVHSATLQGDAYSNNAYAMIGGSGAARSINGNVCEIMMFPRGLSDEEARMINRYLSQKWRLPLDGTAKEVPGEISVAGEPIRNFTTNVSNYMHTMLPGVTEAPLVEADFPGALVAITQASAVPGTAVVKVTKGTTSKEYMIEFNNLHKEPLDLKTADIEDVTIDGGFWKERLDLFYTTTMPTIFARQEDGNNTGFGRMRENWRRIAAAKAAGNPVSSVSLVGTDPWNDGLVNEAIRGASDFIRRYGRDNPTAVGLEAWIDETATLMEAAQDANGFLSSRVMVERPGEYFDMTGVARWYHACYNFGCMAEAGVHYYTATGKTNLLKVATKFAQFVVSNYGYGYMSDGVTPKINMVPDHSLPEEALLKLYVLYRDNPVLKGQIEADLGGITIDENLYGDMVKFWVEMRGNFENRDPNYFIASGGDGGPYGMYAQDHDLYFNQTEGAGHAVRANLFYTGIAAAGREFKDYTYLRAAETIWDTISNSQMYISGGVGASGAGEAYLPPFDLPNDGYCESCAQVALGFYSEYMHLNFGDSKYADVVEKLMYNGALCGISLLGNRFLYEQPLNLTANSKWNAVNRWDWIPNQLTPCCPPMLIKFFSELPSYIYSYNDDNVYVDQFVDSTAHLKNGVTIKQTTEMPWNGLATLTISGQTKLHIRLPQWAARGSTITVNGTPTAYENIDGYATLNVNDGDVIIVTMPMQPMREYSDPRVSYNVGKVALSYGPVIYTVEARQNPSITSFTQGGAHGGNIYLQQGKPITATLEKPWASVSDIAFRNDHEVVTLNFTGGYMSGNNATGPYTEVQIKAIPFYARSNGGGSGSTRDSNNYGYTWFNEREKDIVITPAFSANSLSDAAGDGITATVSIKNNTNSVVNAVIIVALYNSRGALAAVESCNLDVAAASIDVCDALSLDVPAAPDGCLYKLFVWRADTFAPFEEAWVIPDK